MKSTNQVPLLCSLLLSVVFFVNCLHTSDKSSRMYASPFTVTNSVQGPTDKAFHNVTVFNSNSTDVTTTVDPLTSHRQAALAAVNLASSMGMRTLMMGGMLFGLSLIPAIAVALGGSGVATSLMSSLGVGKRSIPEGIAEFPHLPLLEKEEAMEFLDLLTDAFRQWGVADDVCKQLFVCEIYQKVVNSGTTPNLTLFEESVKKILAKHGGRKERSSQGELFDLFFEAARSGIEQQDCRATYRTCTLSLTDKNTLNEEKKDDKE